MRRPYIACEAPGLPFPESLFLLLLKLREKGTGELDRELETILKLAFCGHWQYLKHRFAFCP